MLDRRNRHHHRTPKRLKLGLLLSSKSVPGSLRHREDGLALLALELQDVATELPDLIEGLSEDALNDLHSGGAPFSAELKVKRKPKK